MVSSYPRDLLSKLRMSQDLHSRSCVEPKRPSYTLPRPPSAHRKPVNIGVIVHPSLAEEILKTIAEGNRGGGATAMSAHE